MMDSIIVTYQSGNDARHHAVKNHNEILKKKHGSLEKDWQVYFS